MVINVTKSFKGRLKIGDGRIVFEERYDRRTHIEEIATAKWLNRTFGGDVVLLSEMKMKGAKNADCLWNGREWEFKNISSDKFDTIDVRIRKAYMQIRENCGGMVLDFTKSSLSIERAAMMVEKIALRRIKKEMEIIIRKGTDYRVFQTKK